MWKLAFYCGNWGFLCWITAKYLCKCGSALLVTPGLLNGKLWFLSLCSWTISVCPTTFGHGPHSALWENLPASLLCCALLPYCMVIFMATVLPTCISCCRSWVELPEPRWESRDLVVTLLLSDIALGHFHGYGV